MSINRHNRIIQCLQGASGSLTLSALTACVNAKNARDYTESIIAQDLKTLSVKQITHIEIQNNQLMCSLTGYGQTMDVVFDGSSASGRGQGVLQEQWAAV